MDLLPFGTKWLMTAPLRERAAYEREEFRSWVSGLDVPSDQTLLLTELLELADEREFVEGRAACFAYEAELARRTGLGDSFDSVLEELIAAGLVTRHDARVVFGDGRPGSVFRVRRPGVVLTIEAAGSLWLNDSWLRTNGIRRNS